MSRVDLGELGFERGAHLLVRRALQEAGAGERVTLAGASPDLLAHARAWARAEGLEVEGSAIVAPGPEPRGRLAGAERAGGADPTREGAVVDHPPARWGLAPRGALVERGTLAIEWPLADKSIAWADEAARIYAQAAASQWDPATAIPWKDAEDLPRDVEDAVVQVMTYLVENETAALVIPAGFAARVHPHFREVMQVLAIQAADEARHVEVFTRRATLRRDALGFSSAGGQASLGTLLDEPDFALSSFLLSVLGEGSFLSLLWFLSESGPDVVTRAVTRLAAQDEARHVAFGLAHLQRQASLDAHLLPRLAMAIRRRHDALRDTAGLNAEVFDALVVIAAGSWEPEAIGRGHDAVLRLQRDMDDGRVGRLRRLGFDESEARSLSSLHTRNFM